MLHATEHKKQILIVEDEGLVAADIQRRLEELGYAVTDVVPTGEEALAAARSTPPDMVLMDIRLKGEMDGIDTAGALRRELGMPVVYLTAHADPETVRRAALTEPLDYLLKPVSEATLRYSVQSSLYRYEMQRRVRAGREAPANTSGEDELNFLKYRLEIISRWPESPHKRATINGIEQRLAGLCESALAVAGNL